MLINPKQPVIRQIKEDEYEYQADLYDAKVFFNDPQEGDYNHLMKIVKNDNELIFKMLNASPTNVTIDKEDQLTYHNIFDGVDAVYTLYPDKVKEDIIINSPEAEHTFKFRTYESLPATMQDDGSISYSINENDNQSIFELPAPYATDVNGNEVNVEMTHEEGYYTYKVIADKNTVYPIILDPTVTTQVASMVGNVSVNTGSTGKKSYSTYMIFPQCDCNYSITFRLYSRQYKEGTGCSGFARITFIDKNGNTLFTESINMSYNTYLLDKDINITKNMYKVVFETEAETTNVGIGVNSYVNILSFTYDDPDSMFIQETSEYSGVNYTKIIATPTPTKKSLGRQTLNSTINYDKCKLFLFSERNNEVTINNIYSDTNNGTTEVKNGEFTFGYNSLTYINVSAKQETKLLFVAFINNVPKGTQEYQLFNMNEEIIKGGQETLNLNESAIDTGNESIVLNEYSCNGGNYSINIQEFIKACDHSELPINITLDDVTRYVDTVSTHDPSSIIEEICADDSFNDYVRIIGFRVSASISFGYYYYNCLGEKFKGTLSSPKNFEIIDTNGLSKLVFNTAPDGSNEVMPDKFEVIVDSLKPGLTPIKFCRYARRFTVEQDVVVKLIGEGPHLYKIIDASNPSNFGRNRIELPTDKVLLKSNETYYIDNDTGTNYKGNVIGIFKYDNGVAANSLLSIKENICYGSDLILNENIYGVNTTELEVVERIINDNESYYLNIYENINADGNSKILLSEVAYINNNELLAIQEKITSTNQNIIDINETIKSFSCDIFDINEKVYVLNKNDLVLSEKTAFEPNCSVIDINELVKAKSNNTIDINESIYAAYDLTVAENIFVKDKKSLLMIEGAITNNEALLPILMNVQATDESQLSILEDICINGEDQLPLNEKIVINDQQVINIIENTIDNGYIITPIKEKIIIYDNDKLDVIETICIGKREDLNVNEFIVGKSSNELVILEQVKNLESDSVSIIENVNPVSLAIVENIKREIDYATRLITFTKPIFQYKKGK